MNSMKHKRQTASHCTSLVRPKTDAEWAAYRCKLSCKIGRDAIEGKGVPEGCSPMEYAMFNLLHAIEELSKSIGLNAPAQRPPDTEPAGSAKCAQPGCQNPACWMSPMGNPVCDMHARPMNRLYRDAGATCTPLPNK
jgi:hypothetical protein